MIRAHFEPAILEISLNSERDSGDPSSQFSKPGSQG